MNTQIIYCKNIYGSPLPLHPVAVAVAVATVNGGVKAPLLTSMVTASILALHLSPHNFRGAVTASTARAHLAEARDRACEYYSLFSDVHPL